MNLKQHFSDWQDIRQGLYELLDKVEEDELDFKPFDGSWSIREIFVHISNTEEGWLRYVVQRETDQWIDASPGDYPTRETIRNLLEETHEKSLLWMQTVTDQDLTKVIKSPWDEEEFTLRWILWHVLEHEIHHRGELSLILGLLGKAGLYA